MSKKTEHDYFSEAMDIVYKDFNAVPLREHLVALEQYHVKDKASLHDNYRSRSAVVNRELTNIEQDMVNLILKIIDLRNQT